MARVIAIVNNKGGVGKTTTAVELAFEIARDRRVGYFDLDGQANGTKHIIGSIPTKGLYDLLLNPDLKWTDFAIEPEGWGNLVVLPGTRALTRFDKEVSDRIERELLLATLIGKIGKHLDYIIIDVPPSMDARAVNALCAADFYIVPTDSSEYALDGIKAVHTLAEAIKVRLNTKLEFWGIIITRYEKGNSHAVREVLKDIEDEYPTKTKGKVSNSVRVIEAQKKHTSIQKVDSEARTAQEVRTIANLVLETANHG